MLDENIFQNKIYGLLILFTYVFKKKTDKGLRFCHYRWALIKNNDKLKSNSILKHEMEKFFSDDLQNFYDKYHFENDEYITSNNNLSNFLKRLVEKDILKKDTIENIPFYRFSDKGKRQFCMNAVACLMHKLDITELNQWCDEIYLTPDYFKKRHIRIYNEDGCNEEGEFIARRSGWHQMV